MADELKPCPFCGEAAKVFDCRVSEDEVECYVECKGCGAQGAKYEGAYSERPAAVAAWNRRADHIADVGNMVPTPRPPLSREEVANAACGGDLESWDPEGRAMWLRAADAVLALIGGRK